MITEKERTNKKLYGYFYDSKHFFIESLFKPNWSLHDYKNSWYRGQVDLFKHLIHDVEYYLQEVYPEEYKKCYIVFSDKIALKGLTNSTKQLANKLEKEGIIKKLNNWYYLNQSEQHCYLCEYNDYYEDAKTDYEEHGLRDKKIRLYDRHDHLFKHHNFYKLDDNFNKISKVTDEDIEKNFGIERKKYQIHDHRWMIDEITENKRNSLSVKMVCRNCDEVVTLSKYFDNFSLEEKKEIE